MSLFNQKKDTWYCQRCDFEMVEIEKDTIKKIVKILNPNFLTLPKDWKFIKSEWIKVCPRCDSYSLGLDTELAFPIRTISGNTTTINDLDFVKAHKHTDFQEEILRSERCGCFYCLEIFRSDEITDYG